MPQQHRQNARLQHQKRQQVGVDTWRLDHGCYQSPGLYRWPSLVAFSDAEDERFAGVAVASKVCHSMMHGHHWTLMEMAGTAVTDKLAFDAVLLHHKKQTSDVCLGKDTVGGSHGFVCLLSNE